MDSNNGTIISLANFLTLAITSGLVSGIIATIGNVLISILGKRSDEKLERMKYLNSINDYRYKELAKLLDEMITVEAKFDTNKEEWALEHGGKLSFDLYDEQFKIAGQYFKKIFYLLDSVYQQKLKTERQKMFDSAKDYLNRHLDDEQDDELLHYATSYAVEIEQFFNALIQEVQEQIEMLIVQNKN